MHIPFFNYKKYCKDIDYVSLVKDVLETGYLIGGPYVDELKRKLRRFIQVLSIV